MKPDQIIIEQLLTEKSLGERSICRYAFKVNVLAGKIAIRQAVQKLFNVKVKAVNTSIVRPKRRVLGRSIGRTSQWKKAYVTLEAGQKIEELET